MVKLSIIVPIYGVEQYLRKCVDSLLNQDIIPSSEYEIILVDDGGHDKCPQICDEYAADHDNIRVVHRENGGLSAARNSGIEKAQGEYIMFVDSDDYIEPNVLCALLKRTEDEQLDVLRFDYQNVRMANGSYEVFQPYKNPHIVDTCYDVVDGVTYLNTRMPYECYAWQWIIRKSIVSTFTEGVHFEDVDWLPRMMLNALRVNSTQTVVYNYFWREGSITLTQGNKEKMRKNIDDRIGIVEKYNVYIAEYPQCRWLRNMQSSMACGILTHVAIHFYAERDTYINRLREWKVFPLSIAEQGKVYMRRAKLINLFGPRIYCMLMHWR